MTEYLPLLFLFIIPAVLVGAYVSWNDAKLLRALRTRHEHVWRELGSPGLIMNNSIRSTLALRAYLRKRRFQALDDPEIAIRARRKRVAEAVYLVFIALTLPGLVSSR